MNAGKLGFGLGRQGSLRRQPSCLTRERRLQLTGGTTSGAVKRDRVGLFDNRKVRKRSE
jgi:hypothetical protein